MPLDTSIPGSPTLDDWPTPPVPPFRVLRCGGWRDGIGPRGTFTVELVDAAGTIFPFFFDGFLGRLCYGTHSKKDAAAFIRKGSKLEIEAFAAIESAPPTPELEADPYSTFGRIAEKLAHARRWKGSAGA